MTLLFAPCPNWPTHANLPLLARGARAAANQGLPVHTAQLGRTMLLGDKADVGALQQRFRNCRKCAKPFSTWDVLAKPCTNMFCKNSATSGSNMSST
eukprot:2044791-Alexandrium_andersonii.AAC.1